MNIWRNALSSKPGKQRALLLLGEVHNNPSQRQQVTDAVRAFRPDVLIHELAYEDEVYTQTELRCRIDTMGKGQLCDPELNADVYRLALELEIPLVGCDIDQCKGNPAETFPKRERRMAAVLERSSKKYRRIAMVVGDAHLRERECFALGGHSKLIQAIGGAPFTDYELVRAPKKLREVE